MCLFVLLNTKEDIWKNVLIKQISFPIDYHSRKKNTYYGSQWGMRRQVASPKIPTQFSKTAVQYGTFSN